MADYTPQEALRAVGAITSGCLAAYGAYQLALRIFDPRFMLPQFLGGFFLIFVIRTMLLGVAHKRWQRLHQAERETAAPYRDQNST